MSLFVKIIYINAVICAIGTLVGAILDNHFPHAITAITLLLWIVIAYINEGE